jgi:hypothetical protein
MEGLKSQKNAKKTNVHSLPRPKDHRGEEDRVRPWSKSGLGWEDQKDKHATSYHPKHCSEQRQTYDKPDNRHKELRMEDDGSLEIPSAFSAELKPKE